MESSFSQGSIYLSDLALTKDNQNVFFLFIFELFVVHDTPIPCLRYEHGREITAIVGSNVFWQCFKLLFQSVSQKIAHFPQKYSDAQQYFFGFLCI